MQPPTGSCFFLRSFWTLTHFMLNPTEFLWQLSLLLLSTFTLKQTITHICFYSDPLLTIKYNIRLLEASFPLTSISIFEPKHKTKCIFIIYELFIPGLLYYLWIFIWIILSLYSFFPHGEHFQSSWLVSIM